MNIHITPHYQYKSGQSWVSARSIFLSCSRFSSSAPHLLERMSRTLYPRTESPDRAPKPLSALFTLGVKRFQLGFREDSTLDRKCPPLHLAFQNLWRMSG